MLRNEHAMLAGEFRTLVRHCSEEKVAQCAAYSSRGLFALAPFNNEGVIKSIKCGLRNSKIDLSSPLRRFTFPNQKSSSSTSFLMVDDIYWRAKETFSVINAAVQLEYGSSIIGKYCFHESNHFWMCSHELETIAAEWNWHKDELLRKGQNTKLQVNKKVILYWNVMEKNQN